MPNKPALTLREFCKQLPKVELHAHLNGSLSRDTMVQLVERKKHEKPKLANFQIPESIDRIDDFFVLFPFIYQLTDDAESIKIATRNVIDEFAKDGVKYLELRTTPRKNPSKGMTKESYLRTVLSVINEPREDIIVKLIISVDRRNSLQEAEEAVDLAVQLRSQGVVGIDLCGDVTKGHFENLKPAFERAQKEHGFRVTLHFNEILDNLKEAPSLLSIVPDRLGHATIWDDYCRKTIFERRTPIEICLTSNFLCKTVKSVEEHHVKELLKRNHPFILCVSLLSQFFQVFPKKKELNHCIHCLYPTDG
ncbi:hypothetical protein BDF20DRAFT_930015 [Mycotypha africana]|uniref:uncharacterized protein n=1 Tax=Mycotypha africana TaxID=64632 RepID=UPI0023012678|nr:uncharacterized protein BDF20DRAFT_930015 [Mycotypha africana]KAI8987498.1 hypothetical protein BDF20DRAFT_930015 [Mycotypha africana]